MRKFKINVEELIPGSKYFKWKEALWLPRVEAYAAPEDDQIENIKKQAKALDKVREYFGKPMIIHSWLRPMEYNRLIGGASRSRHMFGDATDFSIVGITPPEVQRLLETTPGIYPGRGERHTPTWTHLDLSGTVWFNPREIKS